MNLQIPGINIWLIVIILVCAIVAIIVILLLLKLYHLKSTGGKAVKLPQPPPRGEGDRGKPVAAVTSADVVSETAAPLMDLGDISKNVQALAIKYGLDGATISTTDGLVIATTSDLGPRDAAQYSQIWNSGQMPDDSAVHLFGLDHRGSTVVGIIRSSSNVPDHVVKKIREDTEKILRWGL